MSDSTIWVILGVIVLGIPVLWLCLRIFLILLHLWMGLMRLLGIGQPREVPRAEIGSTPGGFYTKIAGVTKKNDDGKPRQKALLKCRAGEVLYLKREPGNKYDINAIAVYRFTGDQLGYVRAETAEDLAPLLDSGAEYECVLTALTGGGDKIRGANVWIQPAPRTAPASSKA